MDQVIPIVYHRLCQLARQRRRTPGAGCSPDPTGPAHEACLKLVGSDLGQAPPRLEALDARQKQILEQRCFGGLPPEELAVVL